MRERGGEVNCAARCQRAEEGVALKLRPTRATSR